MKKGIGKVVLIILVIFIFVTIVYVKPNSKKVSVSSVTLYSALSLPNDNNAYYNNLSSSYLDTSVADPTIVQKTSDGCFYVFATDKKAYKSCDSKNWNVYNYNINGNLPHYDYFWAPEIHKINNYYYMFFTLVTWGNGYPFGSTSKGSVYYARSTDLKNFEYLGEVPYGSNYFTGRVDNKNHIDGSLLIDDGKYYFYYKLETRDNILDYQNQQIYAIRLTLNSNGTFSSSGNPQVVMRRNTESNPITSNNFTWHCWQDGNYAADTENINEGPFVIKKNGRYYLTYSIGEYTNDSYHVVSATSSSPFGPFVRDKLSSTNSLNEGQLNIKDFVAGDNYPSTAEYDSNRNSNTNIYGTGHGAILSLNNYDSIIGYYNEYYYIYHSNKYSNGRYVDRKLTLDGVNFDSAGNIFVNGPTVDNQPLISGSYYGGKQHYKVPTSKYTISGTSILNDGIKYSARTTNKSFQTTNKVSISFKNNERVDLTDIWIYGNGSNLGVVSGKVYINESTNNSHTMDFSIRSSGSSLKIQLPSLSEKVKNLRIVFNKSLSLSEVELVRNTNDNYYVLSFNGNGGNVKTDLITLTYNSSSNNNIFNTPTLNGYDFLGWYDSASGGTLVYSNTGKFNSNATSYWTANGKWIKKSDVTLYAHWKKASSSVPTAPPTAVPTPTSTSTATSKPTQTPTSTPTPTSTATSKPTSSSTPKATPTSKPTSSQNSKVSPTDKPIETSLPENSTENIENELVNNNQNKQNLIEYLFSNPIGIVSVVGLLAFFGFGIYNVKDYIIKKR